MLKQTCKRKTDKISSFKEMFQDLQNRNLLSAEHVQQLQGISKFHTDPSARMQEKFDNLLTVLIRLN